MSYQLGYDAAKQEVSRHIDELISQSYKKGHEDGYQAGYDEYKASMSAVTKMLQAECDDRGRQFITLSSQGSNTAMCAEQQFEKIDELMKKIVTLTSKTTSLQKENAALTERINQLMGNEKILTDSVQHQSKLMHGCCSFHEFLTYRAGTANDELVVNSRRILGKLLEHWTHLSSTDVLLQQDIITILSKVSAVEREIEKTENLINTTTGLSDDDCIKLLAESILDSVDGQSTHTQCAALRVAIEKSPTKGFAFHPDQTTFIKILNGVIVFMNIGLRGFRVEKKRH
jgi:hypothetical protein